MVQRTLCRVRVAACDGDTVGHTRHRDGLVPTLRLLALRDVVQDDGHVLAPGTLASHAQQDFDLIPVGEVFSTSEKGVVRAIEVPDPDPLSVLGLGQDLGLSAVARPDLVSRFQVPQVHVPFPYVLRVYLRPPCSSLRAIVSSSAVRKSNISRYVALPKPSAPRKMASNLSAVAGSS